MRSPEVRKSGGPEVVDDVFRAPALTRTGEQEAPLAHAVDFRTSGLSDFRTVDGEQSTRQNPHFSLSTGVPPVHAVDFRTSGLPDFRTVDVNSFDWIFFDCFNTLIEDTDDSGEAYGFCGVWQAAVDLGMVESVEEAGDRYRTWRLKRRQADDAWREASLDERLCAVVGDANWRSTVIDELRMTWFRNFPLQTGAINGVPAMLAYWHERKKLAVVSNFYVAGYPRDMLGQRCLLPYLHLVIDSAQVGAKKPDARIYRAALAQAGVSDPSRVLFIGDNWNNDVIGPRALGMQVAWFARNGEAPQEPSGIPMIRDWGAFR